MDSIWYNYVKSTVFNSLRKHLKTLYPNMFFTTEDQNGNPAKFPTLYLQEIESPFYYDLEHKSVIGMNHYMRLQVFTDTNSDDCADIRAEAVDFIITKYGYNVRLLPVAVSGGIYWGIAQLNRRIGAGDKDIVM